MHPATPAHRSPPGRVDPDAGPRPQQGCGQPCPWLRGKATTVRTPAHFPDTHKAFHNRPPNLTYISNVSTPNWRCNEWVRVRTASCRATCTGPAGRPGRGPGEGPLCWPHCPRQVTFWSPGSRPFPLATRDPPRAAHPAGKDPGTPPVWKAPSLSRSRRYTGRGSLVPPLPPGERSLPSPLPEVRVGRKGEADASP